MNDLRVFISSTFRDLQEERDHLVKKIFPEIRALCRQRGLTFTEVDLRWGLTEEEGALGRIIRICLEEVDRCKPYFIGLLGSNHGWVPDAHDIYIDPELLVRYPWVEQAVLDGASLTELEFIEGVFAATDSRDLHAFFYRRQGSPGESEGGERLQSLCERIGGTGCPFRDFRNADQLGTLVRDDLIAMIDDSWPAEATPSLPDVERRSHLAFAASRIRAYIPRMEFVNRVNAWIDQGTQPLVVTAPSGMGKSSLVAHVAETYSRSHPGSFVIQHYVGASDASTTLQGLIRHVIDAVREHFALDDPVPDSSHEIEQSLAMWLRRVAQASADRGESVLIIIDAVNQLEERARTMKWLPVAIPPGVKLILSTTPGVAEMELSKRGWEVLAVTPIAEERVRQSIVVRYLGEFHKGIAPDQLRRLTADDKSSSPLYLRVVAEELRLHGEHETVADLVTRYVDAADIDIVFQLVLERMERDFGQRTVSDMLGLLRASRSGLNEHELLEILEIGRLDLSRLLFALDYHLIRRDGLLGFFHDYLRNAVTTRYLPDTETEKAFHRRIAEYFARAPFDSRCCDEEPWQWREAEEWERLADCLARPDILMGLNHPRVRHELSSYWRALEDRFDPIGIYGNRLGKLGAEGMTAVQRADVADAIGEFFTESGRYAAAEPLLRLVYRYRRLALGPSDHRTTAAMEHLATVLYHEGRYPEAEEMLRNTLRIMEDSLGEDHPRLCPVLDSLAATALQRQHSGDIEHYCRRSLAIAERHYGREHPEPLDRLVNLAEFEMYREANDIAVDILQSVVDIAIGAFGSEHPFTLRYQVELGFGLRRAGMLRKSTVLLERLVPTIEALMGEHPMLARALECLGLAYAQGRLFAQATPLYRRAYDIRLRIQGIEHPDVMHTHRMLAWVLRENGRLDEAETILRDLLPRQIRLLPANDVEIQWSMKGLAAILNATNRMDEAAELHLRYPMEDSGKAGAHD